MNSNHLVLVGGGGHCCSVVDVLRTTDFSIAGIVHGPDCNLTSVCGYPPLGRDSDLSELRKSFASAVITVGQIKSPRVRQKLYTLLKELDFHLPVIRSSLAHVAQDASIGEGTVILHQALVNSQSRIGENCIINSKVLVEHECIIDSHCHIAVAAVLCGNVKVGSGTFIGAGSIVREGVSIGRNCIVGMGAHIYKDIPDGQTVTG